MLQELQTSAIFLSAETVDFLYGMTKALKTEVAMYMLHPVLSTSHIRELGTGHEHSIPRGHLDHHESYKRISDS